MDNKVYIGSGKPTQYNGVKITLDMSKVEPHVYATEKGRFLTCVVSARKEADQYGKTHTVFVMLRQEEGVVNEPAGDADPEEAAATEQPAKSRKRKGSRKN